MRKKRQSVVSGRLTLEVRYRAETTKEDARQFYDQVEPLARALQERLSNETFACTVSTDGRSAPVEVEMIQYHEPLQLQDPELNKLYDVPVVVAAKGSARRKMRLRDIRIVDGWKLHERLKKLGLRSEAEAVLELWLTTMDLRANLAGDVGGE